ncbi:FAD binding domain-containing protein [Melanomma pulvis-pyrius CBS 109.77]|uniref:FAD binding domain-containing protein n=1 Tax=Melanomma pulvis-pyrius CBS 109.77 TaxID=1314802 RepID=A0A6A6X7D1_9PLEO|nr:FAD binding domain-containing protein [Melanomma pulvis-pyrius CBS 109.77]
MTGCDVVLVTAAPLSKPDYLQPYPTTPRNLTANEVMRDLGGQLSTGTTIFGPGDAAYLNATKRWNILEVPDIQVVVQVGQESDVAKIVQYCNRKSIEFLAVNRGHSLSIYSMDKFKGIQIDLKQLTGITLQHHNKSAILQGGTYGINVISTLWDLGYVTPTGAHECVGYTGLALGGGHGRYEGLYGLASDNFIKLNTVLANGSTFQVSKTKHADLFWGMQGAGHQYGIVTSAEVKVYPREVDTWHYHNYYWSGDKLETLFERLNAFHGNGSTPVKMGVNFGSFTMNPKYSNTSATLWWSFVYAGSASEAEPYLRPFNEIEALDEEIGDVPYPQIPTVQGTDIASGGCEPTRKAFAHSLLQTYNVTTERAIYDSFNANVALYPELTQEGGPVIMHEGYATKAVEEAPDDSSAYAHRHEHHILYVLVNVPANSTLLEPAIQWTHSIRDLWDYGRRSAQYINYCNGDESLESIYGYEPWRLARLRGLKTRYDPSNRFRFHVPIRP